MLINGIDTTLDPEDGDNELRIIDAVSDHLRQDAFAADPAGGALAAALTVRYLRDELRAAAGYVVLRDAICATMADPDAWDGDESEESVLIRYVEHLATASHGDCDTCDRRIGAAEGFEAVDRIGNLVPAGTAGAIVYCTDCA